MSEILFQFLIILLVRFFILFVRKGRFSDLLFYNLFIFLAAVTKPVMYIFVVPNLVLMAWLGVKSRTFRPVLLALIPSFLVLAYAQWNVKRTGNYSFSSIQTTNLINYNLYFFLMNQHDADYASYVIDSLYNTVDPGTDYSQSTTALQKSARKIMFDKPLQYGWFHVKGMLRFFLDPGRFDLVSFFFPKSSEEKGILYYLNANGIKGAWRYLFSGSLGYLGLFLILIFIVNSIKSIGLILFTLNKRIDLRIRVFLIALLFYLAFVTGPLGASRFAMPVIPLVVFMAFSGVRKLGS